MLLPATVKSCGMGRLSRWRAREQQLLVYMRAACHRRHAQGATVAQGCRKQGCALHAIILSSVCLLLIDSAHAAQDALCRAGVRGSRRMVLLAITCAFNRPPPAVRIKPARCAPPSLLERESAGVAAVFWQAFSLEPRSGGSSSSSDDGDAGESGSAAGLGGTFFPPRSQEEWQKQVVLALQAKQDAALASRQRRLQHRREAELRGGWVHYSPKDRQQAERWRRQRSFVVLVAEDCVSGEVLGCAAVSLAQPEAALPPPFPTSKPRRVYVSNIAVLPQHRRQGVGSLLLQQCERQARLWRQDSLWLHVELKNADALRLYQRLGYTEVGRDPVFTPNRRCLMRKEVEALRCTPRGSSYGNISMASGLSSSGGGGGSGGGTATSSQGSSSSGKASSSSSGSGSGSGSSGSSGSSSGGGVFVWSDLDLAGAEQEEVAGEQPPASPAQPPKQA
ncbi:hypothetical protein ABPG75_002475 [Micractinium tetrahymenae]